MDDQVKKKLDEDWKKQVELEKEKAKSQNEEYHQPTFSIFLSSLSMQAMIAMGKVENPASGKTEKNFEQARFLIDTLEAIKEKTINNLTKEEDTLFNDYLFNLRMMYVEVKKDG